MKSTEFLKDVILPMIQKAHDDWTLKKRDFVGTIDQPVLFQGKNFHDIPTLYHDKITSAASVMTSVQQKGYVIRLPDPHGGDRERIYRLFIVSPGKNRTDAFYRNTIYKFFLWISVLSSFSPEECSREMNVYLYLLPDLKVLPQEKSRPLSMENVNTAFTRFCSHATEVNIFREEEWFKVFIHETFHNHGLDFSLHFDQYDAAVQTELRRSFPALKSRVLLYESYCEFWAETLHSLYVAFFQSRRPETNATTRNMTRRQRGGVWTRAQKIFREEREFTLLQCVKVLDHYGLTYADLLLKPPNAESSSPTFKDEYTNTFAYYVIKCVMVHCNFLDWHLATNGPTLRFSYKNIMGFCHWLNTARHRVIPALKRMEQVYKHMPKTSRMSKTLRMVTN